MHRRKDSSSVDPSSIYSNSYLIDTDLGYTNHSNNNNNNNSNLAFANEFKIDTSVTIGSQSAPTSLMTGGDQFNYPHYTPNMDFLQCLQSAEDSFGSSCSSGTKLSYAQTRDHVLNSACVQSSGQSIDSYFSETLLLKSSEVDENDNSVREDSRRGRGGRGRVGYNSGTRKRHINQENNDGGNHDGFSVNGSNGGSSRGHKHGKALARHPFIPSYMDPNNGPHLCVVCRHNASGFHYRVMACEGCKGFFRRTVQNNLVYSCKFNNKCEIQPHNRAQCQECRWRKCLEVGMAKDLVLSEDARRAKKELIAANRAKKLTSDKSSNKISNELRDPTSPVDNDMPVFTISEDDERIINQIKNAFDETDVTKTELTMDFQDPGILQILQCIVDHHVTSLIIKCDIVDDGNINSAKFNYPQEFNTLAIVVEPILQRVLSFAFMLPKFSELSINDQIILLKNACFDIISLRNAINYDRQSHILRLEPDFIVTKDLLKLHKLVEPTYVFVGRISSLNMDYIEISLMAALALLSCDRMGLQDLSKVESLQDDILRSIDCYMKQNSYDNTHRQSELYATILPELRSTTSWHTQILINSITSINNNNNNLLPTIKAIYHNQDNMSQATIPPPFIESSNQQFLMTSSPMSALSSSPNSQNPIYTSDLKYLSFPFHGRQTMPSLYSSLDNVYINSHLPTHSSGQLHHNNNNHHQQQPSFTDLLIESSSSLSDMKINSRSLLVTTIAAATTTTTTTDKYNNTQESTATASSSLHANYTPVTNHNQSTNHNPVFDFTTDLI